MPVQTNRTSKRGFTNIHSYRGIPAAAAALQTVLHFLNWSIQDTQTNRCFPRRLSLFSTKRRFRSIIVIHNTMGGDGGTKAVNRSYLRGAGSATTTADAARTNKKGDPAVDQEEAARAMRFCALTDQPLNFGASSIVTCPYGRLYNKEAAVEALIRRKQQPEKEEGLLGSHIRGLKDLYDVRFQIGKDDKNPTPLCPVTGRELNGKTPSYALIPGNDGDVNVVSEYALKQLSEEAVFAEYGAQDKIRLGPPPAALKEIKKALLLKRETAAAEKEAKKQTKKDKRKRGEDGCSSHKKRQSEESELA